MSTFLLLILGALIRHHYLAHILLINHRVNGFRFHHPSSSFGTSTTVSNNRIKRYMVSSGAPLRDDITTREILQNRNSYRNEDDKGFYLDENDDTTRMSYPWSKVQEWALRDNLPKYTVRILTEKKNSGQKDMELSSFVLWRNLQEDVPELCGYPIDSLRSRQEKIHSDQQNQIFDSSGDDDNETETRVLDNSATTKLGVLPFLQDYEFSAEGGISGYVYGLDGLSDGSRIQTSQVENVKVTLPKGYIQTSDGTSFELGRPLENNSEAISKRIISDTATYLSLDKLSDTAKNIDLRSPTDVVENADELLLRLGATTGILLAGATAFDMLSHHLTVNVFWV
mmetsp:Transcript_12254/g.24522  ORF Transcript_12254/g.24522 Transcript_12254/m.24522 type:complete len:340 (+) Transcript_12254:137-1156(+)